MEYRELGATGLKVSALAFGGSSLGAEFGAIDEARGVRAVQVAVENGINLIDTAPYYGRTTAETVLGKALRIIPRERYYLATKIGRYGKELADFDFSAARVRQSVDESLARLGVDYVDFIQAHDIEFGDLSQIINETIPAMREVQRQGKARFVGITGLPVKALREVLQHAEVDQIQSYCHGCLNDDALFEMLPLLREKGVAVFNAAPLAMRLLSDLPLPDWHPAPAEVKAKCAQAARFCREQGSDIGKLALQFAVSHREVPTTIVGTANPDRVLKNIRDIEEPMDEELLARVLAILQPIHNRSWLSGRPENN